MIYVTLREAALNVMRVAQRRSQGGHDVLEARILARPARSHAFFEWFTRRADLVLVFDNTDLPARAAGKLGGTWRLWDTALLPADLAAAVDRLAREPG